jgi:subtilisin-like proprotein convertase family protein
LHADVSAAISSSAGSSPVVVGSNVVYALTVTNNGPDLAVNVIGLLTQGVSNSVTVVSSNFFGSMAPGSGATVFFTANVPLAAGLLTNTWAVSTGSQEANTNDNTATLDIVVTQPEPIIAANGVNLLSESFAPINGAGYPIGIVTIVCTLENIGAAPATNLTAVLLSSNGVFPITFSANYGKINPGASAAQVFSFTNIGIPGSAMTAVLSLTDNANAANAYPLGTVSFTFTNSNPSSLSFANTAGITIPNNSPGAPYPSQIAVSSTNLVVGKVTVALQDFTHSFPHDVNVLLASPSGQQAVLMAHVGGPYSVTNLMLGFDDAATSSLTEASLVSGTNHPTQILPLDFFPAISGQPSNTNLSVFNGANPNGVWSLYVYDETNGNSGSIAGWTLGLTLVNPAVRPVLQAASRANTLTLTLQGQVGQSYVIQVSTNLSSWTSVLTNTAIGAGQFTLTNSLTNAPVQFYRALHWTQ